MFAEEQLKRIQDKCQQLVRQYQLLQKENQKLKEELLQGRDELARISRQAEQLEQQLEIVRLNTGNLDEKGKKELEKRLNGYLKEIDRCITLLSE